MAAFSHFRAHLPYHFLVELLSPAGRRFHAMIDDGGLLDYKFASKGRFVEGKQVLELLLAELGGVKLRRFADDVLAARCVIGTHLGRDLIEILAQHRIRSEKYLLGPLDHAGKQRLIERGSAF